jgi:hypothetical protein
MDIAHILNVKKTISSLIQAQHLQILKTKLIQETLLIFQSTNWIYYKEASIQVHLILVIWKLSYKHQYHKSLTITGQGLKYTILNLYSKDLKCILTLLKHTVIRYLTLHQLI